MSLETLISQTLRPLKEKELIPTNPLGVTTIGGKRDLELPKVKPSITEEAGFKQPFSKELPMIETPSLEPGEMELDIRSINDKLRFIGEVFKEKLGVEASPSLTKDLIESGVDLINLEKHLKPFFIDIAQGEVFPKKRETEEDIKKDIVAKRKKQIKSVLYLPISTEEKAKRVKEINQRSFMEEVKAGVAQAEKDFGGEIEELPEYGTITNKASSVFEKMYGYFKAVFSKTLGKPAGAAWALLKKYDETQDKAGWAYCIAVQELAEKNPKAFHRFMGFTGTGALQYIVSPELVGMIAENYKKAKGKTVVKDILNINAEEHPFVNFFADLSFHCLCDIAVGSLLRLPAVALKGAAGNLVKMHPGVGAVSQYVAKTDDAFEIHKVLGISDPGTLKKLAQTDNVDEVSKLLQSSIMRDGKVIDLGRSYMWNRIKFEAYHCKMWDDLPIPFKSWFDEMGMNAFNLDDPIEAAKVAEQIGIAGKLPKEQWSAAARKMIDVADSPQSWHVRANILDNLLGDCKKVIGEKAWDDLYIESRKVFEKTVGEHPKAFSYMLKTDEVTGKVIEASTIQPKLMVDDIMKEVSKMRKKIGRLDDEVSINHLQNLVDQNVTLAKTLQVYGGGDVAVPAFRFQLKKWWMPEVPIPALYVNNRTGMRAWQKAQSALHLDPVTQYWKMLVLAKPSTFARISLDEPVRMLSLGIDPLKVFNKTKRVTIPDEVLYSRPSFFGGQYMQNWATFIPGDPRYNKIAASTFNNMADDVVTKAYLSQKNVVARKAFLLKWLDNTDSGARFSIQTRRVTPRAKKEFVDNFSEVIEEMTKQPYLKEVLNKAKNASPEDIAQMTTQARGLLPPISGRTLRLGVPDSGAAGDLLFKPLESVMGRIREVIYEQSYLKELDYLTELKRVGKFKGTKGVLERQASKFALDEVERVSYGSTRYMFEHNVRNLFPFLPAYRDFFKFWSTEILKKPSRAMIYRRLQKMPTEAEVPATTMFGGVAGGAVGAVAGAALSGTFIGAAGGLGLGMAAGMASDELEFVNDKLTKLTNWDKHPEYKVKLYPRTVFYATGGSGVPEESWFTQNWPGWGVCVTVPLQALQKHYPEQFAGLHKIPTLSFSKPGVPLNTTLERAFYGASAFANWSLRGSAKGATIPIPTLGRDPDVRKRAAINILRMQAESGNKPDFELALRDMAKVEGLKTIWSFFSPMSGTIFIKKAEEMTSATIAYTMAETDEERAKVLKEHPKYRSIAEYFEAGGDRRVALLKKNPWMLPYIVGYTKTEKGLEPTYSGSEYFERKKKGQVTIMSPEEWLRVFEGRKEVFKGVASREEIMAVVEDIITKKGYRGAKAELLRSKAREIADEKGYAERHFVLMAKPGVLEELEKRGYKEKDKIPFFEKKAIVIEFSPPELQGAWEIFYEHLEKAMNKNITGTNLEKWMDRAMKIITTKYPSFVDEFDNYSKSFIFEGAENG